MLVLTLMALLPPLILMIYVYKKDKVEKEPIRLIIKTLIFGVIAVLPTVLGETVVGSILEAFVYPKSLLGLILHNFIGIAIIEEFCKMQACKLSVWKNKEFNYTFDGVVYAVAAAIGFAALENLLYVYSYGFVNAIVRALTSIPGHTIFGIFMGINLGFAKLYEKHGDTRQAKRFKRRALIIPTILHGTYDFMCSSGSVILTLGFFVFIIALEIVAVRRLNGYERTDTPIFSDSNDIEI